jgi:tRNA(fMet)-specific endonuclease VapC
LSARFLLDTNVLSEALKPLPNRAALEQLDRHAGEVVTASVVWHELVFGVACLPKGKRRSFGERYLSNVVAANIPVLGYDAAAASWHANERARLAAAGRTPPFADGQIAAIAAVNGLTLVTANARDFAGFRELRVVCWHA